MDYQQTPFYKLQKLILQQYYYSYSLKSYLSLAKIKDIHYYNKVNENIFLINIVIWAKLKCIQFTKVYLMYFIQLKENILLYLIL